MNKSIHTTPQPWQHPYLILPLALCFFVAFPSQSVEERFNGILFPRSRWVDLVVTSWGKYSCVIRCSLDFYHREVAQYHHRHRHDRHHQHHRVYPEVP
ncbi:hypothetical protein BJY00DRAFT_293705 [Aspergillus carlsbadensis]|nr:hypothetical protein BJY00DRAFT_293705 [Aspergillus carlsbadensis]